METIYVEQVTLKLNKMLEIFLYKVIFINEKCGNSNDPMVWT